MSDPTPADVPARVRQGRNRELLAQRHHVAHGEPGRRVDRQQPIEARHTRRLPNSTTVVRLAPSLVRCPPNLGRFRANLCSFGRTWPNLVRVVPLLRRASTKVRRFRPRLVRIRPYSARSRPNLLDFGRSCGSSWTKFRAGTRVQPEIVTSCQRPQMSAVGVLLRG